MYDSGFDWVQNDNGQNKTNNRDLPVAFDLKLKFVIKLYIDKNGTNWIFDGRCSLLKSMKKKNLRMKNSKKAVLYSKNFLCSFGLKFVIW